jgi:hypothetical protein
MFVGSISGLELSGLTRREECLSSCVTCGIP